MPNEKHFLMSVKSLFVQSAWQLLVKELTGRHTEPIIHTILYTYTKTLVQVVSKIMMFDIRENYIRSS